MIQLNIALPESDIQITVDPPELAPWTADFWQFFPVGHRTPDGIYRLSAANNELTIETPAGRQTCDAIDAPPLWDLTMRNILRYASGPFLLHAGLIIKNKKIVLITGNSGSGKSTLVNLMLDRGWQYTSDEFVHLTATGLTGMPRCLHWSATTAPPDVTCSWGYPVRNNLPDHTYGHRASQLGYHEFPWPYLSAIVHLKLPHASTPTAPRQIDQLQDGAWLQFDRTRPESKQIVGQLRKIPVFEFEGGAPEMWADHVESISR